MWTCSPSGRHSRSRAPPSWPAMLLWESWVPKPSKLGGPAMAVALAGSRNGVAVGGRGLVEVLQ